MSFMTSPKTNLMREYCEDPSQTQSKDCFKDNFNVYVKCGLFYVQAGNISQKESYLHGYCMYGNASSIHPFVQRVPLGFCLEHVGR
jgi:hypothetical protein